MAGDGVSLPTSIVQLGNLAKTQARTQAGTQATNVAQDLKQEDVAPAEKVQDTEKTEQDGVDAEGRRERERERRRRRDGAAADESDQDHDDEAEDAGRLGGLIDTKA